MAEIVLQFVDGGDISAFAIEWFEGGWCSHIDSVLPRGGLLGARMDVYAGVPPGMQIRPPNYSRFKKILKVTLPCDQIVADTYYSFINAQIGKPYDKTAIFGFIMGRDWRETDSWFCSEVRAYGLEVAKYFPYPIATPANKVTPMMELCLLSTRVLVDHPISL